MHRQVPNLVLRLSATNFSSPALLVNCHFDRCRRHNHENEDEEDDVDDEEDADDDGKDGYDHAQRCARSRQKIMLMRTKKMLMMRGCR